jgi:hypothetical protein
MIDPGLVGAQSSAPASDGSLAFVQSTWVKDFVTTSAADTVNQDEELLIALPTGG